MAALARRLDRAASLAPRPNEPEDMTTVASTDVEELKRPVGLQPKAGSRSWVVC